jgi:hypothetical protein
METLTDVAPMDQAAIDAARTAIDAATRFATGPHVPASLLHRLATMTFGPHIPAEPQNRAIVRGKTTIWLRDDARQAEDIWDLAPIDQGHAAIATWFKPGDARRYSWPEAWYLDGCKEWMAYAPPNGPDRDATEAEHAAYWARQQDTTRYEVQVASAAHFPVDPTSYEVTGRVALEEFLEEKGATVHDYAAREEGEAHPASGSITWRPIAS